MAGQQITFMVSQAKLAAQLDMPEGPPRAYALFATCFTCNKDVYVAKRVANAQVAGSRVAVPNDHNVFGSVALKGS